MTQQKIISSYLRQVKRNRPFSFRKKLIACMKPKDLGYAAETWTTSSLTKHINNVAEEAGFDHLSTITESGVYRILAKANIKPFRIQYYCEKRDPDFDDKMHNVLLVHKQLSLQFDGDGRLLPFEDGAMMHILSYDEKPGIQAIVFHDNPSGGSCLVVALWH